MQRYIALELVHIRAPKSKLDRAQALLQRAGFSPERREPELLELKGSPRLYKTMLSEPLLSKLRDAIGEEGEIKLLEIGFIKNL